MTGIRKTLLAATRFCFAAPIAAAAFAASSAGAQESPVVKIDSGAVGGVTQNNIDEYLGIPYAAPPLGDLRWTPPQPAKPWTGTVAATKFGRTCAQNSDLGVFASPSADEDCLYLNVYVSKGAESVDKRLPVLVWIHGGALSVGAGSDHDGSQLAAKGSVVVTINYRLGILGFLAHPKLDKEGHPFANYGLMDQQFALKWVKENIAAFGGDPENVTIFGESSGGTSVMSQIVSPGAAGLFQHAISQSGSAVIIKHPNFGAPRPLDFGEDLGAKFAVAAGCADQSVECLRKLPVAKILATQGPYQINQAFIDGTVLPTTYADAFKSGHFNHVTIVNGSNLDEWRWAVAFIENGTGKALTADGYVAALKAYYGDALAPKVLEAYPLKDYLSPSLAYGAAVTDSLFACTGRKANEWLAPQTPTYAYEFADQTAPSYLAPTTFDVGAGHTFELEYLFPLYHGGRGISHQLNPLQQHLADKMTEYWTSLGKAADGRLWTKYDPKSDNYMRLILPEPEMTSGIFGVEHKCAFWDQSGIY